HGSLLMFAAEILHGARPVNIGQQAGVTKTQALERFAGRNVEHFFQGGLAAPEGLRFARRQHGAGKQCRHEQREGDSATSIHFRLRLSKTSTAAAVIAAAYSKA